MNGSPSGLQPAPRLSAIRRRPLPFRGFSRRRLLDLGITPGTRIEVSLDNPFGDPRAFRLRGTVIALRKDQADQILVRSIGSKTTPKDLSSSDCYMKPEEIKRTTENVAQGISES